MYLFDTDVLSQVMRPVPLVSLLVRLAALPPSDQFTSAINVGELIYGAHRSERREYLLRQMDDRLWPNLKILSFDRRSGEIYGRVRAELEKRRQPLAEPDLRIAAIALSNDFTVVTGNVRHFGRVPDLRVENWLATDD